MAGKGAPKTGGRRKGTPNKLTTDLKEAILGAAEAAGGPEGMMGYLKNLAVVNSSAFAALLGKILPTTIQGPGDEGEHKVTAITWQVHDPKLDDAAS
jgi:hypothetical protein